MKKIPLILSLLISGYLIAESVDDMESILDRLEKRLLKREREASTFLIDNERNPNLNREPTEKGKEVEIVGDLPENDELRKLSRTLNSIESEVDRLISDIQSTTQDVIERAKVNNFVEVETVIKNPKNLIIRKMNVSIDNFEVYSLDLSRSIHTRDARFPLFAGPLEPGHHKMKINMNFTEIVEDGLPVKQGAFGAVEQNFDLNVPPGTFKKKWVVSLKREGKSEKYRLEMR